MDKPVKKKLRITWSKREKDLMFHYPNRPDGHLMHTLISHTRINDKTLREELIARGYDITTLKFSIERRADYDPYAVVPPTPAPEPKHVLCSDCDRYRASHRCDHRHCICGEDWINGHCESQEP